MFHMLTCFNLRPGIELGAFRKALADYTATSPARLLNPQQPTSWTRLGMSQVDRKRTLPTGSLYSKKGGVF